MRGPTARGLRKRNSVPYGSGRAFRFRPRYGTGAPGATDRRHSHAVPHPRPHRHPGQPLRTRRDDARHGRPDRQRRRAGLDPHRPPRPRRRHQPHRHRGPLLTGRVRDADRQGDRGPPGRRRARDEVQRPDGRRPQPARQLPTLDHPRGRGLAPPTADRPHRPVPGAPPGRHGRPRGDPVRPHRPRAERQGPGDRQLGLPGVDAGRGTVDLGTPRPRALPLRAADLLDPQPRHRARGAARRPAVRDGRAGVEPARRRHADRTLPEGPAERPRPRRDVPAQPGRAPDRRRGAGGGAVRGHRHPDDAPGAGVRDRPPRGDERADRPALDGATRRPARRGRRRTVRRGPRPHRRDRPAGADVSRLDQQYEPPAITRQELRRRPLAERSAA